MELQSSVPSSLATGLLLLALYLIGLFVYRLFLSPISNVPGPKLATLTFFYEFYYDGICNGRYLWKIEELHRQYGPIIRVNPREVHINDPAFYDQIYANGPQHPRNKIRWMAFHDESMFDTFNADVHRTRRSAMAVSFSKQSIRAVEPLISETIQKLVQRMNSLAETGKVVNIKELWSGLTMDVIAQYCFGQSMENLNQESYGKEILDCFHELPQGHPKGRMFPWLFDLIQKVPISVLATLDKKLAPLAEYEGKITGQLQDVLAKSKKEGVRTVFHEMRDSKQLPEADKTIERFKAEAAIFLGAGTETTAAALTTITYHLTTNQTIKDKLREEMESFGHPTTLAELEKLPYLTGVVQEGIRLSFGVPGRLPRVAPKEDLTYAGFNLPSGTVLSASSYLFHTDEKIFPDPFRFEPMRWVDEEARTRIGRQFVPFSRGARMCIGLNLAYAELYLTIAAAIVPFQFELHDTTLKDVEICHDFFVGMPQLDSKGVQVRITPEAVK